MHDNGHKRGGGACVGCARRDESGLATDGGRSLTMATMGELDLSHDRTNVDGGACALGHPIGASGARVLVTLIAALADRDLSRGMASVCLGGGEATAMALRRMT